MPNHDRPIKALGEIEIDQMSREQIRFHSNLGGCRLMIGCESQMMTREGFDLSINEKGELHAI